MNQKRMQRIAKQAGVTTSDVRRVMEAMEATPTLAPGTIARWTPTADMAILASDGLWHRIPNTTFLTETLVDREDVEAIVSPESIVQFTVVYNPEEFDWEGDVYKVGDAR